MGRREMSARPLEASSRTQTLECTPTKAEVRARAYELYCARCEGGAPGDAVSDWLAAEDELRSRGSGGEQTSWK